MSAVGKKVIVVLCVAVLCSCQRQEKYVAEVLGHTISVDDFSSRYKSYLRSVSVRDNIVIRRQILDNMINEILILDDAARRDIDRDSSARRRLDEIRTQAILLGYARHLTLDTMTISGEELQNEFRRYNTKARARYVYAPTEDSAWALKNTLESGIPYETLARNTFEDPGLANNGGDLGYFGWSEMEPALEDFAFLQPVGTISDPIRLRVGYAIVKIEDRKYQPLTSETDYAIVKEKLAAAVRKRKIIAYLKDITGRIQADLNPVFHDDAVKALFDVWPFVIHGSTGELPGNLERRPDDIRSMPLVTFSDRVWTVNDLMQRLPETNLRQQQRVKKLDDLKEFVIGVATREITYRRAIEQGMERDSVVQNQIGRETAGYVLERWRDSVEDTVGKQGWDESLLRRQYEEKKNEYVYPREINVAEILLRTKSEADNIAGQLRRGAGFAPLARKYSIRPWAAKQGGELGFGPKSMYGLLADTLFQLPAGAITGPLYADPYWGVFKILAKRDDRLESFEKAREEIIKDLAFARRREALLKAVGSLRERTKAIINDDVLENIVLN